MVQLLGLAALGAVFLPGAAGIIFGAAFYGAVTSAAGGAVLGGTLYDLLQAGLYSRNIYFLINN